MRGTSDARAHWLRANGFTPGTGSWWAKTVARADKAAELLLLVAELQGDLSDLLVRDVETVESDGWTSGGTGAR